MHIVSKFKFFINIIAMVFDEVLTWAKWVEFRRTG